MRRRPISAVVPYESDGYLPVAPAHGGRCCVDPEPAVQLDEPQLEALQRRDDTLDGGSVRHRNEDSVGVGVAVPVRVEPGREVEERRRPQLARDGSALVLGDPLQRRWGRPRAAA